VRHLRAVARLVERPLRAAWVVADLLDAEAVSGEAAGNSRRAEGHRLAVSVLGETMDIVRDAPFTPTEQARVDALVALADRLADVVTPPDPPDRAAGRRSEVVDGPGRAGSELGARDRLGLGGADGGPEPDRGVPTLRRHADSVIAEVADRKVGEATLHPTSAGWGVRVYVHPAWRRRGIGLQLLRDAMELARGRGLAELDVRLDAQDLAGLRLVLASGMCGSVSCDSGVTRTRLVLGRPVRART
jgi:GNAT superfamily N-acetyltransferase